MSEDNNNKDTSNKSDFEKSLKDVIWPPKKWVRNPEYDKPRLVDIQFPSLEDYKAVNIGPPANDKEDCLKLALFALKTNKE